MAIQEWSKEILLVDLADDPQLSDDLSALMETLEKHSKSVVLDFGAVTFINSSNIARLLRIRKLILASGHKLVLCDVKTQVWGVLVVTGLEKIFELADNTMTALASIQLSGKPHKR